MSMETGFSDRQEPEAVVPVRTVGAGVVLEASNRFQAVRNEKV